LCVGDEGTYAAINEFLGTDLKLASASDDIRRTQYHIVSGNGKVRRGATDFQGIRYSESPWDPNWFEKVVARCVVQPLNRSFGVTQNPDTRP
jgi:hypothetical protein